MTSVIGEAPAFAGENELTSNPVELGDAFVGRMREEQALLPSVNEAGGDAVQALGAAGAALRGPEIRREARAKAQAALTEVSRRYADMLLAMMPAEDRDEDPQLREHVTSLLASFGTDRMSDTDWNIGTSNDDGTWNRPGKVRLQEGLQRLLGAPEVPVDDYEETPAGDETEPTEVTDDPVPADVDPLLIVPGFAPHDAGDEMRVIENTARPGTRERVLAAFEQAKNALRELSLKTQMAGAELPATLAKRTQEYLADRSNRRRLIGYTVGVLGFAAAGSAMVLLSRSGNSHAVASTIHNLPPFKEPHVKPGQLGGFNAHGSPASGGSAASHVAHNAAPSAEATPTAHPSASPEPTHAKLTPNPRHMKTAPTQGGGEMKPANSNPSDHTPDHMRTAPIDGGAQPAPAHDTRPHFDVQNGETPWQVEENAGVPDDQIMSTLHNAARESGLPYHVYGQGTHEWIEVNGESDTRSVIDALAKYLKLKRK